MAFGHILLMCTAMLAVVGTTMAHGGGVAHQKPLQVAPDADWATRHMAEEHHIANFDQSSFFALHDFDGNHAWDHAEILKTYGMDDPSAKDVRDEEKDNIIRTIMRLMDTNGNNEIERNEFLAFTQDRKGILPDFNLGPGHHWDMEMEYEIHHWEKYHDENTREEDLIHPEDIAHFALHDKLEDEAEKMEAEYKLSIVEQNIPSKFRRQ